MVECMKIFDIKKLFRVVAVVAICMMSFGAHAAYYDDDDYDECPYFTPAYALCTTHAYNAAMGKNPTDSSQIAHMNEIIALKSTVIAQQMKQQYDILNAMVKRFKTQLEKAVLKSKIEVMTGGSSSSSSGGSSSNNGGLANAEDCDEVSNKADIYDCLLRNLSKIEKAAEKDTGNARKQLNNDIAVADGYYMCAKGNSKACEESCPDNSNRRGIQDCVKTLRRLIKNSKDEYEQERAKNNNPWAR